jgi:hypothetical protein
MNTIRQFQCINITWIGNTRLTEMGVGKGLVPYVSLCTVCRPSPCNTPSPASKCFCFYQIHTTNRFVLPGHTQLRVGSLFIKSTQLFASSYLDPHNCALVAFLKQKWWGFPSNLKCGEVHSVTVGKLPKHFYQLWTLHLSRQSRYVFVDACYLLHLVGFFFAWVPSTSCCPQTAHHTVGLSPLSVRANN